MKFIRNLEKIDAPTAVTVGMYDGVHRGHRAVLEHMFSRARKKELRSAVVTFDPHPLSVINPSKAPPLLYTPEERFRIFQTIGIDYLIQIPFTPRIAALSADTFVEEILLEKFSARDIIIGYDHGFGAGRSGDARRFRALQDKHRFELDVVSAVKIGDLTISSTQIRRSLLKGDIILANQMLGKYYSVRGEVVRGSGRGRKLQYPTANIEVDNPRKVVPRDGVYVVYATVHERCCSGLMNVGSSPTFGVKTRSLEVHLRDFDGDLYGRALRIFFLARLRDVKLFSTPEELREQIDVDLKDSGPVFGRFPPPAPEWLLD